MGAGWKDLPVVTAALPGANTDLAVPGAVIDVSGYNAIEIAGRMTAITTAGRQPILLRKRIINGTASPPTFQWQPFAVDKSPQPDENADAAGWFWDRYALPDPMSPNEEFALYNPAGDLTFGSSTHERPRIRGLRM